MEGVTQKGELPLCVFTTVEYNEICELSILGKLEDIVAIVDDVLIKRHCRVGPKTFCPDPIHQRPAPMVLSAQYGHPEVVQYFIKKYGHIIDINHSATITSLTTKKKVHCATALWAASTGGHLDIVKTLLAHGAEVNKATLTQSTPLRGASFHGHLDVMNFLLDSGAKINTPNCIGQSPLCIAAMRGQISAVKFLVEKGASLYQMTVNGYSVMHLSATKGRLDIVQYFLSIGLSPQFQEAKSSQEGYIPCPLFLAASTGQKRVVDELVDHKDCPAVCKADAYLLLGSTRCEISERGLSMGSRDLWAKGLEIRAESESETEYLPPINSYGLRQEMQNMDDLTKLSLQPNFTRYEAYFQSLMIRERCMGYGDQGLIYFLIRRGVRFSREGHYREAELLWFRAMSQEVMVCELEISNGRYGHSEGLQRDLEKDLSQYALGICNMVHNSYKPDFRCYIEFGFKELEIIEYLKQKSENALYIDFKFLLGVMLYIFMSWIYYDTEVDTTELPEESHCSQECETLGCKFVQKYLHATDGTTLLHYALTNFLVVEDEEHIYERYPNMSKLIEALLSWGAYKVINTPDSNGIRPIHIAVENANRFEKTSGIQELVSTLISCGVHWDAVNVSGRRALDECVNTVVKVVLYSNGPASLACQASQCIIKEEIPYTEIGLPPHILDLVKLHDKNNFQNSHGHHLSSLV